MINIRKIGIISLFLATYFLINLVVIGTLVEFLSIDPMLGMLINSIITIIVFIWLGKKYQLTIFNTKTLTLKNIAIGILVFMGIRILTIPVLLAFPKEELVNQQIIETLFQKTSWIIAFFAIVVFGPIVEEILFRSLFIQNVSKKYQWIGLMISSILFSLAHVAFTPMAFISYFSMGLTFGLIYLTTKSLEMAIIIHSLQNLFAFSIMAGWLQI